MEVATKHKIMKKVFIFMALAGTMVLSSCATKGHCDAYGNKSGHIDNDSTETV